MDTKEKIQIAGLIVILIAVAALIYTTIVIIKRSEEIKMDPVEYAIEHTDIEMCTCVNLNGDRLSYPIKDREQFRDLVLP